MAIDQATLARRLRAARESQNLTQEQAAAAVAMPRTALVQIEAGKRAVSSLELADLAKLYRCSLEGLFQEEEAGLSSPAPLQALCRAVPDVAGSPQFERCLERIFELCQQGAHLERLLGLKARGGPPAYPLPRPVRKLQAVDQGARVAHQERRRLELGDAPIADVADVLGSQQIWATGVELPDEMSGLFVHDPDVGMVILVNVAHARARKRFSYSHEYAHALMDRDEVTPTQLKNRNDLSEVRANAFAAAFLMPEGGVEALLGWLQKGLPSRQYATVYDQATEERDSEPIAAESRSKPGSQTLTYKEAATLAHHFGVSYKAMTYRIRNLEWINQKECEELLGQEIFGRQYRDLLGLDPEEAEPQAHRELNSQIAYLAIEAFRRDEISRGRLLELSDLLELDGQRFLGLATAAT